MTASTDPALAPGTRLAHYEIEAELGSGAMGTVYRAHDTSLDRPVAVKVLRARLAEDPSLVERFVREARAAARVNHPNLTHIYFVGAESGCRFFAMEYVPGTTFEQEVATRGPMPFERFVDVMVQSARGLEAAHGAGVIHRDVKPSNLMLLPGGDVKVTDFGLAKSLEGDVGASAGGSLLGTPTYMSPEQCRSRPVDARTDIYALGLTGWFLLAGRPPYAAESLGQMIHDQMNTPLPSIRALRPELPPEVETALARLCEKDPERRPASMAEVAALFEPLRPRPLEPATIMSRATAFAIDMCLVSVVLTLIEGASMLVQRTGLDGLVPEFLFGLVEFAALATSQALSELWLGTTFGKWFFNLRVVREDGAAPSRLALGARFLVKFPGALVFLVPGAGGRVKIVFLGLQTLAMAAGFVCWLVTRGRSASDVLTKTRVVYRGA